MKTFGALPLSSLAAAALVASTLFSSSASAQNLDKAITAYKRADFESAAAQFYTVLAFDADEGDKTEAQYGLA